MYRIAVIRGDGIGPHIVQHTLDILSWTGEVYGFKLEFLDAPAGDAILKEVGTPLPDETIRTIEGSDACLKGPVGETARDVIVYLRRRFDLYANLRPAKTYEGVKSRWSGVDILIVRENTEDVYRGIEDVGRDYGLSVMIFTRHGTERIARVACSYAEKRRRKISIVDKANVVLSTRFFRGVASRVIENWGGIQYDALYVDNAAYQLVVNPQRFDVILTTNMFGDILSDEAAGIAGTLGIAPSANIGDEKALFEPVHGSAPDIDPRIANPMAMILSAGMMLTWLGEKRNDRSLISGGEALERAVQAVLSRGRVLTPDMGGDAECEDVSREIKRLIVENPV